MAFNPNAMAFKNNYIASRLNLMTPIPVSMTSRLNVMP